MQSVAPAPAPTAPSITSCLRSQRLCATSLQHCPFTPHHPASQHTPVTHPTPPSPPPPLQANKATAGKPKVDVPAEPRVTKLADNGDKIYVGFKKT